MLWEDGKKEGPPRGQPWWSFMVHLRLRPKLRCTGLCTSQLSSRQDPYFFLVLWFQDRHSALPVCNAFSMA